MIDVTARPQAESQVFIKRLISALVMIPPVLGAIFYGYPAFDLLIVFGFLLLAYEWINLCGLNSRNLSVVIFYISGLGGLILASQSLTTISMIAFLIGTALLIVLHFLQDSNFNFNSNEPIKIKTNTPWLGIGFFYIGFATVVLIHLRQENEAGRNIILMLFLIAWAADTGAYAFGRLIGGPKLAPILSPNKTWAGFIGGIACAALVGTGFALIVNESGLIILTVGATIMGIISQCGDLLESRIKRLFQVKDAGSLIPGHGGLLDRVDSLLAMSWAVGLLYFLVREEVLRWMI